MSGRNPWFKAVIGVATWIGLASAGTASATIHVPTLRATASTVSGCPLEVTLEVDDESIPGDLVITLSITGPGAKSGNLRAFFLQVADESLLSGLSVTGAKVTGSTFLANGVSQTTGHSTSPQGASAPGLYDLGVQFGGYVSRYRDQSTVTFTLSHATESLDLSLFSGQTFGVNATSYEKGSCKSCTSKLVGVVPEPGTALLIGLGLTGLAASRTRAR